MCIRDSATPALEGDSRPRRTWEVPRPGPGIGDDVGFVPKILDPVPALVNLTCRKPTRQTCIEASGPDYVRSAKEHLLNFLPVIAALATVSPLFAQYGGPAILARGQSPGPMAASQIYFRPYVSVTGTYDTGLNGVSVDTNGVPVNDASYGVSVGFGVSGLHSWKPVSYTHLRAHETVL